MDIRPPTPTPSPIPYAIWLSTSWLMFAAAVATLTWAGQGAPLPDEYVLPLIAFASAAVACQFLSIYRLVAVQDEFVRGLTIKRGIVALGVTITAAVFWGLAEQFSEARHLSLWVIYPLFWAAFAAATPLVRSTRA